MYCLHCGNQIGDQVTFCPYCGQRVAAGPMPDASAQAAQGQDAQGAPNADPAATAAYPGATAQYPAQAAYQQQVGQGAADASQQQAGQGPADPSQQQPAADGAPQGQGEKKGPSAVTVVLAVVAAVAVLALVLVVTGVVDVGGSAATEDQATEATADADDDADATDTDEAADADVSDDAADTDDADADDTSDDATDTSDATSGRSSTSSGSAEATAASLLALLEEEGFDVYVSDECDYVDATMYGDSFSDYWFFDLTVEEDGTISDVDIYVYWSADGDVEEGFAHADELVAYVFDLLADGGYLDDWEDVPDATFPDEFVAEAVEFAAAATEEDSFSEVTETDEGYELWLYFYYDPDDYACMSYEAWR